MGYKKLETPQYSEANWQPFPGLTEIKANSITERSCIEERLTKNSLYFQISFFVFTFQKI